MIYRIKTNLFLCKKIFQTFFCTFKELNTKQDKEIKLSNTVVRYNTFGSGKNVIVFLHGWGQSKATWYKIASHFKKDYLIYVLDLPGFGNSSYLAFPFTILDYAKILKEFFKKRKISKAVLIGHSFGGKIVAQFAAKYPENIKKLVLYSADLVSDSSTLKKIILLVIKIVINPKLSFLLRTYFLLSNKSHKRFIKLCKIYMNSNLNKKIFKDLVQINKPILVIYGKYDFLFSLARVKQNFKSLPRAKFIEFKKSSHLAHLEEEKMFEKELAKFIREKLK